MNDQQTGQVFGIVERSFYLTETHLRQIIDDAVSRQKKAKSSESIISFCLGGMITLGSVILTVPRESWQSVGRISGQDVYSAATISFGFLVCIAALAWITKRIILPDKTISTNDAIDALLARGEARTQPSPSAKYPMMALRAVSSGSSFPDSAWPPERRVEIEQDRVESTSESTPKIPERKLIEKNPQSDTVLASPSLTSDESRLIALLKVSGVISITRLASEGFGEQILTSLTGTGLISRSGSMVILTRQGLEVANGG